MGLPVNTFHLDESNWTAEMRYNVSNGLYGSSPCGHFGGETFHCMLDRHGDERGHEYVNLAPQKKVESWDIDYLYFLSLHEVSDAASQQLPDVQPADRVSGDSPLQEQADEPQDSPRQVV